MSLSKARLTTLVPIRNMDRALKFYTGTLGGKLVYRGEGEMKDGFASLTLGDSELWLIVPSEREPRKLAYTALVVDDIKSAVDGLKQKGVKFQRAERTSKDTKIEGPIAHESFGSSAFFKDPEGNLLMLWQNQPM